MYNLIHKSLRTGEMHEEKLVMSYLGDGGPIKDIIYKVKVICGLSHKVKVLINQSVTSAILRIT